MKFDIFMEILCSIFQLHFAIVINSVIVLKMVIVAQIMNHFVWALMYPRI